MGDSLNVELVYRVCPDKNFLFASDLKDLKSSIMSVMGDGPVNTEAPTDTAPSKKRSKPYFQFLSRIDQTGELTDTTDLPMDIIKYERILRAERTSRNTDDHR